MITSKEIDFPNISIDIIEVIKSSGIIYTLWDATIDDPENIKYFSLDEIVIEEDIFNGPITGYISIRDSSYIIDQLNLSAYDTIRFTIVEPNETPKNCYFRVLDIESSSDYASKEIHGPAGTVIGIKIRFTSDEFLYRNFDVQLLADFIGKISKKEVKENSATNTEEDESTASAGPLPSDMVTEADENQMKGFIQTLVKSMSGDNSNTKKEQNSIFNSFGWSNKQLVADETYNDVWVKTNPFFYPFSKMANSSRLHQLVNYICEYACNKENPDRVDFFFWEDLDQWNFRSISELAKEKSMGSYIPTENVMQENAIVSMEVINEMRIAQLLDSGCIFSEYVRVKPNWSNPYRKTVDTGESLIKRHITYNYDYSPVIADYPFLTRKILQDFINNPIPYKTNGIADNLYGYHASPYNTKDVSWFNFYSHMTEGYTGDRMKDLEGINTEEDIITKSQDLSEPVRMEEEYWQAQFDFCELPGAILRKIYKEIKWPLVQKRWEYSKLKNLKQKWNMYKKNICCEREVPLNFFAVLMDAEKIYGGTGGIYEKDSGGIYAYKWAEVELWPKSALNENLDVWQKSNKIIEFEDATFPFVFIMPSYGMLGDDSVVYSVANDIQRPGTSNTIVKKGNYYTPDTRAYNLNEILNSVPPSTFESGGSYKTLLMNPGITDILGTIVDRKTVTNYPSETIMMPVGKFRIIGETCPDWSKSGTKITQAMSGNNDGGFYFAGRIVQMTAVSKEMLQAFAAHSPRYSPITEPAEPQSREDIEDVGDLSKLLTKTIDQGLTASDYMFVFDVENSHDGLCNGDNCT